MVQPNDFRSGTNPVVKLINPAVYGSNVLQNQTELLDNAVTVRLAGSPTDKMNVYILQVPKGTPPGQISLSGADTAKYRAILYVWVR